MRVGIFDSGLGGLTVLKKLKQKYPLNDYIYYGDNLNVPYGIKSIDELNMLSSKCVEFLLDKNVDIIIIACGTVSCSCYSFLNEKYNVPIINIITPTLNYIEYLENVYVISTKRTYDSKVFKNCIPCSELVPLIENDKEVPLSLIEKYLSNKKIDYLVLGCTHYPLIKDRILEYNNKIKLIDLSDNIVIDENSGSGSVDIYFSESNNLLNDRIKKIIDCDYNYNE